MPDRWRLALFSLPSDWPVARPARWLETVHLPQSEAEETMVKDAILRNRPPGGDAWTRCLARSLGLGHTPRPRGRSGGGRRLTWR
jgi:hypothetical protein